MGRVRGAVSAVCAATGLVAAAALVHPAPALADGRNREPARLAAASQGGGLVATTTAAAIQAYVVGGPVVVPDAVLHRAGRVAGAAGRLGGPDRYATAVAVSRATAPTGASDVVLTSGENFPDALSATPLASRLRAPLLLTPVNRLVPSVVAELRRLAPRRVTIVGGSGAVSDLTAAAARVAAGGSTVSLRRLAGPDRYGTSARLAAEFPTGVPGVVLASGTAFPDGVSAGPVAAGLAGPLLLTPRTSLPTSTRAQLARLAPRRLVIAGGTSGVGSTVEIAAESATRRSAERAAGTDRYSTSSALAALLATVRPAHGAAVATGAAFPDALVGGTAAASQGGPVLLTGGQRAALGTLAADLARARRVGSWLQLSLDFLAHQQLLSAGPYVAHDAAYQAASIGTLYGWDEPEALAQLTRLRSVRKPDGGYGIERTWDAFGDGSTNPASTSYLVTVTDHAGLGLLAGLRAGAVTAAEVGQLVDLVLAWPHVRGDENCLAYSTSPSDRAVCVYNVNSGAAWFLQSAWDAGVQRPGQHELADRLYRHDLALESGGWWPYSSLTPTRRQDWNHNAASIDFQFQLDTPAGQASLDAVMPGGWIHPDPATRTRSDVMGYARLLAYACAYRAPVPAAARTLSAAQRAASEAGQLALWTVRTTASCGEA